MEVIELLESNLRRRLRTITWSTTLAKKNGHYDYA